MRTSSILSIQTEIVPLPLGVLGDLVGEWLGWGVNAMINGRGIWPGLLIDYGFALFFGIFFQYFSIGPMSGQYGPKTLLRAAKADFLSLTAFEIGYVMRCSLRSS